MFLQSPLLALLIGAATLPNANSAFFYPNPQTSLIESILVDTHGAHSSGFADAITPCSNYVSGLPTAGRETAAQWLRVAFHDFVTARVDEGTGGVDASIGFETLREEDSGSAFNDSFAYFRPYVNAYVSTADLVALSVSMSVGNCGGPQIPFRPGRIDATGAGEFGVPAPETELDLTLEYFANAGFNQVDSIGLTACGHTLGSVHHGGFPTVVGPEAVTVNNTNGGLHFDSTVDVFDTDVLNEYLDGTGNAGGPLVTSFNESSRSDLRLYESDGNATMIALQESGQDGFFATCSTLLRRMVETVPSNVVLGEVVSPQFIKPVNASFSFDSGGNVLFSGYIRILTTPSVITPTTISLSLSNDPTALTVTPEPATGYSIFGTTTYFPFSTTIADPSTLASFTVSCTTAPLQTFSLQTQAFVVPSRTSFESSTLNVTIAAASSLAFDVKVSAPIPQQGTLGPAISIIDGVALESVYGVSGDYELWEGSVSLGAVTGAVSVRILVGGVVVDTYLL